jgi:serine/threonine protein kinase
VAPPAPPAVGTVLSHYRIDAILGAGGMGVVYRATDLRLNRTVALKVIGADAGDSEQRRRFLKEARAASAFSHPNIVTIHEVDTAGAIDFIVMELVDGRVSAGDRSVELRVTHHGADADGQRDERFSVSVASYPTAAIQSAEITARSEAPRFV